MTYVCFNFYIFVLFEIYEKISCLKYCALEEHKQYVYDMQQIKHENKRRMKNLTKSL